MRKPNWRNLEDYDSLDDLTPSQRAWEFLRRNPEYIKSWESYLECVSTPIEDNNTFYTPPEELWGPERRWGLRGLYLDPDETHSDIEFSPLGGEEALMIFRPPKEEDEGVRHIAYLGCNKNGTAILEFDINQSIKKQLATAEETLKRLRRELKERGDKMKKAVRLRFGKKDNDGWKLLLRVLDADAEITKPTDKEIADILFPQECLLDKKAKSCPLDNATIEIELDSDLPLC
jgi:hypothetical protein